MDVQFCAFTFSAPPSANPTHPLGRNEATCATALFLLNTNTFQQNTKICTNTFQLLSCLPFYFCTRHHYKFYSNYFVTLLAVPANTQDSAKYRCCDLSNMTSLLFSSSTPKNVTKFVLLALQCKVKLVKLLKLTFCSVALCDNPPNFGIDSLITSLTTNDRSVCDPKLRGILAGGDSTQKTSVDQPESSCMDNLTTRLIDDRKA